MPNVKIKTPFFSFNPKSYFYGKRLLDLAIKADQLAAEFPNVSFFFTVPYADLFNIAKHTKKLILTAQHMDGISPGKGMGSVLPESVYDAGARAVFLNHAEHPLKLSELVQAIKKAKELGMISIVCADTVDEAQAITLLKPDILLCEPTELIGTGQTSDVSYIENTNNAIKKMDESILVLQAAGVSSPEDVYNMIKMGADGTGCTSGITEADDPETMLKRMFMAVVKFVEEGRNENGD